MNKPKIEESSQYQKYFHNRLKIYRKESTAFRLRIHSESSTTHLRREFCVLSSAGCQILFVLFERF